MDGEVLADAARGLRAIVDAVDRGALTATSLDELELLLHIDGAVVAMRELARRSGRAGRRSSK